MITYEGFGTVAVLDPVAQTLTLTHSGMSAAKHKKAASPWVIPLGAIESVEVKPKTLASRGALRCIVRGGAGWSKLEMNDLNALFGGKRPVQEFGDIVRKYVSVAAPADIPPSDTAPPAAPPPTPTEPRRRHPGRQGAIEDPGPMDGGRRGILGWLTD